MAVALRLRCAPHGACPRRFAVRCVQELVYKQGQAGVTRASVTIVFNNKDKKGSPVDYESYDEIAVCRQVAIGGRNKYLINGHVAQQNKVQNLFHSVQLNVNNPHFLIMQGRITKVINMAPMEILGLIAEAAGTKMYETKKEAAQKTIEKKQVAVRAASPTTSCTCCRRRCCTHSRRCAHARAHTGPHPAVLGDAARTHARTHALSAADTRCACL